MEVYTLSEWNNRKKKKNEKVKESGGLKVYSYGEWAEKKGVQPLTSSNKRKEEDVAPVTTTGNGRRREDIAPVKTTEQKDSYFQKGALSEGFSLKNLSEASKATKADMTEDATIGILGLAERVWDGLVQYSATNAYFVAESYNKTGNPTLSEMNKRIYEQSKKEAAEYVAKDIIKEEEIARKIITEPFEERTGINVEQSSYLGSKGDALVQSASDQLVRSGLHFVPVVGTALATGVTGLSVLGGEAENAYKNGATYEEALISGMTSATGEMASEALFGGIKLGGKTVTESFIKNVAQKIPNKFLGTLAKWGFNTAGEGAEEIISGYITALGQHLTYMDEKEINELFTKEDAWESFVAGSILGGMFETGNLATSKVKGVDYLTGNTNNEQKVIDKVVEKRIAEQEADGTKLNKKEKAKIEEAVKRDLEKGYIDIDTIESVLGGETYEGYKSLNEKEKALQDEIRALESDPKPVAQRRVEAAKAELEKIRNGTEKTELKNRLSEEVKSLAMSDRLAESYNEKVRKTQAFNADLTRYDEKMQTTVKKAVESGILNNSNRTHEFVDMIAKLSADKGVSFDFTDNENLKKSGFALDGKIINGLVKGNDVILNVDSHKALNSVVGHEITHVLEGTELYAELQTAIKEYATTKGEYDARLKEITVLYEGVDGANVEAELMADLVGDYLFTDSDFISKLSTEKPNVFKRIYDEIKYFLKIATAGSKEARQLEQVKRAFDKAYKEATTNTEANDVNFSLVGKENGVEVYETSNTTKELSYKERKQKLLDTMKNEFAGRTAKFTKNGEVYYAFYDKDGLNKGVYGDKKSDKKGYKAKINIGADGNYIELAENALYVDSSKESGKTNRFHKDAKEWDYYVKTVKSDGVYYDVLVNVKNTGDNQFVYDITLKETGSLPEQLSSYDGSSPVSTTSVPQIQESATENAKNATENADIRYSMSTQEQNIAPTGKYNVYGKDVRIQKDVAPMPEISESTDQRFSMSEDVEPTADTLIDSEESERIPGEDLTRKNADRIKTIQSEIQGYKLTKDVTNKEFADKIAQKQSELEALQRKDTKKATELRNQITRLEARRDDLLKMIDRKIERANKRIESIENESRFEKRKSKQKQYRELFGRIIGDTSTWVDKKLGIQYQTNTLHRNLRDIVRDAGGNRDIARADAIYDELQGSVNRNEAKKNREANILKKPFRDMKINSKETEYIQMLGELRHNPDTKLTQDVVDAFYQKYKGKIDVQKVDKAIDEARKLYDSLYDRVNAALSEHGFKEMGYRKGYFPHFTDPKRNWLSKLLNWKVQNDEIPTDIAGLTELFEPQRTWQSFDKHRMSDTTDYNFLKGLDNYVNGALDWIYHIEDIQKHRAFETEIRYRHSSEEVQKKIDEYRNNPMLSAEEVETLIQNVLREAKNPLNNFVTDLHTRTNILAGKKSSKDRNMESDFNRHAYSIMTNVTNRVTANQVVGSISSALTNFIPITQSWGQVNPTSSLVGMKQTIQSYMSDDGVIAKSDFLTNRLAQNEALYKDAWDKIGDKVGGLMEIVDNFTSQTVWRSKYYENIKNGMTEAQAIKDADQFAENVIGGRSKGNQPTIFHAKNPVTKMLTSFQLEVANQYGYMFKDMPQDIGKEAMGKLVKGYATMFVGAYAYNVLTSTLTGRDSAFDPIGIIEEFIKDLGGDDDEEEENVANAIGGLASNIAEEIPFVGGLLGGGRIPISSALPYNASIADAYADVVEGDWKSVMDELSKPLYYGLMPMGGGQIRKSMQGLSMFSDEHPVSGSYTKSGSLRFPVEDTFLNKLQAGVFGQYASKNAREYFDRGEAPLREKQIQEYVDLDLPISEYWNYRSGLKKQETLEDKFEYINDLNVSVEQKNIMINNVVDRKEKVDMSNYDDFANYEEFDFYTKNTEKYKFLQDNGVSYSEYKMNEYIKERYDTDYSWYKNNPDKVTLAKAITDNVLEYRQYMRDLNNISADKDANGKAISGSAKEKKAAYIFSLNISEPKQVLLYRSLFDSQEDRSYNDQYIVDYLYSDSGLSQHEISTILKELDITVNHNGW